MPADKVIKYFNAAKHITACFFPSRIAVLTDALPFQQLEETFCPSIVIAVASPAHVELQVVTDQETLPSIACKLSEQPCLLLA